METIIGVVCITLLGAYAIYIISRTDYLPDSKTKVEEANIGEDHFPLTFPYYDTRKVPKVNIMYSIKPGDKVLCTKSVVGSLDGENYIAFRYGYVYEVGNYYINNSGIYLVNDSKGNGYTPDDRVFKLIK